MEADLSLHFFKGIVDLLMNRAISMEHTPAWMLPFIEFTITTIYILLGLLLQRSACILNDPHRILTAIRSIAADLFSNGLELKDGLKSSI